MTRIVLDTNILVSAMLNPRGFPAQVYLLSLRNNDIQLCISADVYAEYEEVIQRKRFGWSDDQIKATLHAVREISLWVRPTERLHVCLDPDDDIFLECAYASHANYLVTGNTKHFPPSYSNTLVVTARDFIQLAS